MVVKEFSSSLKGSSEKRRRRCVERDWLDEMAMNERWMDLDIDTNREWVKVKGEEERRTERKDEWVQEQLWEDCGEEEEDGKKMKRNEERKRQGDLYVRNPEQQGRKEERERGFPFLSLPFKWVCDDILPLFLPFLLSLGNSWIRTLWRELWDEKALWGR